MDIDRFWEIVDCVNSRTPWDMDEKCKFLALELQQLPRDQIIAFERCFLQQFFAAYTHELWAAVYIMAGGCSDDSFMDFRATLISMGRSVFERAVASPATLIELPRLDRYFLLYEGYQYVAGEVYERQTGECLDIDDLEHPEEPSGIDWDEDRVSDVFPDLAAKYAS